MTIQQVLNIENKVSMVSLKCQNYANIFTALSVMQIRALVQSTVNTEHVTTPFC